MRGKSERFLKSFTHKFASARCLTANLKCAKSSAEMGKSMKTAILTGASSGIGAAIAKELLSLGYEVFGFGRDFTEFSAAMPECKEPAPFCGHFHPVVLDLMQTGILTEKIHEIRREHEISLLVNNAGAAYYGLHEELNPRKIHEMVTVNLEVPMLLCQLLLRDLKKNQGQMIQISSVTAKKSSPHGCAYGATKAGLTAFSESLFDEVRKYGVRITALHPDMTRTKLYRNADFTAAKAADAALSPQDVADAVRMVLTARDGLVFTDLTLTPQRHQLVKKQSGLPIS